MENSIEASTAPVRSDVLSTPLTRVGEATAHQNHETIRSNVREITHSRLQKILFWFQLFASIALSIGIGTALGVTIKQPCEGSIRWFLISYQILQIPVMVELIYHYRYPPEIDAFGNSVFHPTSFGLFMLKLERVIYYVDLFLLLLGSLTIFGGTCHKTSPILFITALTIIFFKMFLLFLPLILLLMLLLCLPCVIVLVRWLYPVPNRGASEQVISNLPLYYYSPDTLNYGTAIIQPTDATCAICLQNYQLGANLRALNCRHHFHQECLDEWLKLQASCPLCVQPIMESP